MQGWGPRGARSRRPDLPRAPRSARHGAGDDRRALWRRCARGREGGAPRVRRAGQGHGDPARGVGPQPEHGDGRDRGRGRRDRDLERDEAPAVFDPRARQRRARRDEAAVPLPRPASPRATAQPRDPPPGHARDAARPRWDGLHRGRDPHPHPRHPRGRARLPRPEPRAPRRVVRAAAVAADLQADPDGGGDRSLLPDLPLLPRRGPAGRPTARVQPDRHRDVVRDDRARLRGRRGRGAADLRRRPRASRSAPSAACPTTRPSPASASTPPTCASAWSSSICAPHSAPRPSPPSRTRWAEGGIVKGFVVAGAAGETSRKVLDGWTNFVRAYGMGGLLWGKVGEGRDRGAPRQGHGRSSGVRSGDRGEAGRSRPGGRGPGGGRQPGARAAAGARRERARPDRRGDGAKVRVHLGRRLPGLRVRRRRGGGGSRPTTPSRAPRPSTSTPSRRAISRA